MSLCLPSSFLYRLQKTFEVPENLVHLYICNRMIGIFHGMYTITSVLKGL